MNNILRGVNYSENSEMVENKSKNNIGLIRDGFGSALEVNSILEFTQEELKIIEEFNETISILKNMISSRENISDSMEYSTFLVKRQMLPQKLSEYFENEFCEFRKVFLKEKITQNLKYPNDDLLGLKHHVREMIDDYPDLELSMFYGDTVDAEDRIKYVLTKI